VGAPHAANDAQADRRHDKCFLHASGYSAVTLADCTDNKARRLPPSVPLNSRPTTLGVRVGATYMLADQSSALRHWAFVSFLVRPLFATHGHTDQDKNKIKIRSTSSFFLCAKASRFGAVPPCWRQVPGRPQSAPPFRSDIKATFTASSLALSASSVATRHPLGQRWSLDSKS
jgi:hypothetical protein